MDTPRSSHASRRSYPNLHNLSLAPLSSQPLDASTPPSPSDGQSTIPHTSYIQLKSAPTTPGILSLGSTRNGSRNRRRHSRGHIYTYDGYFPNPDAPFRAAGDVPKAKSTNALLGGLNDRAHTKSVKRIAPLTSPPVRHVTTQANDEWLHRAGLAIAGETRESKGQSWLIRRESSTSLVHQGDEFEEHRSHDPRRMALLSGEHFADDEYGPQTPRWSRLGSRVGSRVQSARNSRRGSRTGSRADLIASLQHMAQDHDMVEPLHTVDGPLEPDFVTAGEETDSDEEEIARLAREPGFGLGGWMDRLIGWTLFSVEEDGEETSDDEQTDHDIDVTRLTKEEMKLRKEVEAKRKKMEREAIVKASASAAEANESKDERALDQEPPPNDGSSWQDAAWLLSVASKVLL